jgi:hypothetical protein
MAVFAFDTTTPAHTLVVLVTVTGKQRVHVPYGYSPTPFRSIVSYRGSGMPECLNSHTITRKSEQTRAPTGIIRERPFLRVLDVNVHVPRRTL